jgi:hypothetical protein
MGHNWTEKDVAGQFEESISTLKKLPPVRAQGYFNAWPEIVRTPEEIAAGEPMPLRLRATPDAISRMEQTLRWITWVDVEERRLIWNRAARRRWKTICWELGCDRSTAWRKWNIALAKIAARLNAGQK